MNDRRVAMPGLNINLMVQYYLIISNLLLCENKYSWFWSHGNFKRKNVDL